MAAENIFFDAKINGTAVKIVAYKWKSKGLPGIRYDIYIDDVVNSLNCDLEYVVGWLAARMFTEAARLV